MNTLEGEKVLVTNRICRVCANKYYFSANNPYRKPDNHCCETCSFWVDNFMYDANNGDGIIIDRDNARIHYRLSSKNSGFNFGGQLFEIEYNDGRREKVYLSHQGTIPEYLASSFLPNAKFVGQA